MSGWLCRTEVAASELKDWDQKALGSRVLFHIPVEIGYRLDEHNSLSAYFEHMSNAYTVDPNEGSTASACATATGFESRLARPRRCFRDGVSHGADLRPERLTPDAAIKVLKI